MDTASTCVAPILFFERPSPQGLIRARVKPRPPLPLSHACVLNGGMNSARYFIPRADDEPRRTPLESPFRRFVVHFAPPSPGGEGRDEGGHSCA